MSSGAQERPLEGESGAASGGAKEAGVWRGGAPGRGRSAGLLSPMRLVGAHLHGSSRPGRAACGGVRLAGAAVGSVEYKGVKQDFPAIRKLNVTNLHFT